MIDWEAAEVAAATHMQSLGFTDARLTKSGSDGGIDVTSAFAVAQVKHHAAPVGRPDIQRLRGAAHEHRLAIFYSTSGYTQEAKSYADSSGVALFRIETDARPSAANSSAAVLSSAGANEETRQQLAATAREQFRLAFIAIELDLRAFKAFQTRAGLGRAESLVLRELVSKCDRHIAEGEDAARQDSAEAATRHFSSAVKCLLALRWLAGGASRLVYSQVDEAADIGWAYDQPGDVSSGLLRIASNLRRLRELTVETFIPWNQTLNGVDAENIFDIAILELSGVIETAGLFSELLSQEALDATLVDLSERAKESLARAEDCYQEIQASLSRFRMEMPRDLVFRKTSAHHLSQIVARQITGTRELLSQ